MTRSRSKWGSVFPKKDRNGRVTAWLARYPNPLDHGRRVGRQFGPEYRTEAHAWLEQEHYLVVLHKKGIRDWQHPRERNTKPAEDKGILFEDYLREWLSHRKRNGNSDLRGSTKRNLKADISHFLPYFKGKPVAGITTAEVRAWYEADHPEGPWAFYGACQVLHSVLQEASNPTYGPPLLDSNPFVLPFREPAPSKRREQEPITREQAGRLARAMPARTRLSIWLGLLVGGLRTGEVCALQIRDIDLDHRLLHVRHSVCRGPDDVGPCRLGSTKTLPSMRIVPIPSGLIQAICDHIDRYCVDEPEAMLFPAVRSTSGVMSPTTLGQQSRKARVKAGRPDITFHSLRATHATMLMIEGGTLREAMDELGHTSEKIAVRHYQRIVPKHRIQVVENLSYAYLPVSDTSLTSQIEQLREQRDRLDQKILELEQIQTMQREEAIKTRGRLPRTLAT
ncbi:site-specific integrase [Bifidobacterium sp. B4081]|uniref:tyrosine-type recombinase/integrase n=1 Tax=unclassified Bifidobacterium TaxID=2608897 RepID=UPI00226A253E|nr:MULTISPECIES: tyrosine-type recombinase/integrase [unclassified Bifidobacterium]MCX8644503.1 site-specific integrase [Bifidobacterium sp. B4077]MCX8646383.1 site-specific integrase [Bifidobacterium sp. B4081]MCX8667991.1 site-specific integrase [Bifidobacterium sp. B3998]